MLSEACPECRFDPTAHTAGELPGEIRRLGARFGAPLTRGLTGEDLDALLDERAEPDAWSALELAAHSRDILVVFDDRVRSALAGDAPSEPIVDWEAMVEAAGEDGRADLAAEIAVAAGVLADRLEGLSDSDWQRPGMSGRGREVTVNDLAVIALHEGHHHLLDIGRALRAARGR